jgi:hypothetical protein
MRKLIALALAGGVAAGASLLAPQPARAWRRRRLLREAWVRLFACVCLQGVI